MARNMLDSLGTSVFCENLAMMYGAGITSDEAIDLLAEDAESGPFFDAANAVRAQIGLGKTLSEAIVDSGWFPEYAASSIAAGEVAGRTEETLSSLALYYDEQSRLERRIKSAVMYPTVLLFLMVLVLLVMVKAVLPVFVGVYESLSGNLASSSFAYVGIAQGICWVALVITLVLAVVLLVASIMASVSQSGRDTLMRALGKLPGTRQVSRSSVCAQFMGTLATFVASGLNPDDAVAKARESIADSSFAAEVDKVYERMHKGETLSNALHDEHIIDPLYARMLISAGKSGTMEEVLERISGHLYEDSRERMESLIGAIEPGLAGFLTIMVGLALVSIMLPLIGIMGGIG